MGRTTTELVANALIIGGVLAVLAGDMFANPEHYFAPGGSGRGSALCAAVRDS